MPKYLVNMCAMVPANFKGVGVFVCVTTGVAKLVCVAEGERGRERGREREREREKELRL